MKTICVALMFLALAAGLATADLIAHWPLDEGSGEDVVDVTGNGYDGIFRGNPSWGDGMYGKALDFDGDDYVEVAEAANIKPDSITIATWVWFDDVTGRRDFLSRDDDYAFSLGGNNQNGKLWAVITTDGDWLDVGGDTAIETGRWYHVALTFDTNTKELTLYLDGEQEGQGDAPQGLEHRRGGALTMGTFQTRYLDGKLDEIKIFDVALSEDEIKTEMEPAAVDAVGKLSTVWGQLKK